MDINILKTTAAAMVAGKKGLLAADESSGTIKKRFDKIGLTSTPETNLAYRKMLFTTPGIEEYISGVILFDETIRQEIFGKSIPRYLSEKGILPGIKVDKGAVDMPDHPGEKVTEGLEGLNERMTEYEKLGAKFAKWRAVITIGEGIPTDDCINENANRLAEYAYICQQNNIVPIVEPEVLMDGEHSLEDCRQATERALKTLFTALKEKNVFLEGVILKPNMVVAGKDCPTQPSVEEVAKATVDTLSETVPSEVPGIMFLSGGQSPDMATENLRAICEIGGPWAIGYSFARALQDEALTAWGGKEENVKSAQDAFKDRAQKVSQARA